MGKILNGILGGVSGKVAGVVGARWKDKHYLRSYAVPANPQSDLQIVQRDLFKYCVAFAKVLVGPVFNAFTDRLISSMSGFNYFIKSNITLFTAVPTLSSVKITEGKLYMGTIDSAEYDTGANTVLVHFDDALGNNGALTDKVYMVVYDTVGKLFYFPPAAVNRSVGELEASGVPSGLTAGNIRVWVFACKLYHEMPTMVSNSITAVCTAA